MSGGGLLFDKDGTLFDFRRTWSDWTRNMLLGLSQGDPARAGRLAARIGYDLRSGAFLPGSPVIAGTAREVAAALSESGTADAVAAIEQRLAADALDVVPVPVAPLGPLMAELRAGGYALGVATNDAEAAARAQLDRVGAGAALDFVAGYDSGFGAKPAPGMCRAFAEAIQVEAQACIMVGDSAHDLVAGRAAGMRTVAVLSGPAPRSELAPLADAVLPDVTALSGWLAAAA